MVGVRDRNRDSHVGEWERLIAGRAGEDREDDR